MKKTTLILDHFDSFTYNLVQYVEELVSEVKTVRTDVLFEEIKNIQPTHLILSPGPGHPSEVGRFKEAIEYWKNKIPILGVCLGHQALALAAGAAIQRNYRIMHGKTSLTYHNGEGVFKGIRNPLTVMRYHSFVTDRKTCEENGLEITAWTNEKEIMAVRYKNNPLISGIQFHPESIFTESGKKIILNFLKL